MLVIRREQAWTDRPRGEPCFATKRTPFHFSLSDLPVLALLSVSFF